MSSTLATTRGGGAAGAPIRAPVGAPIAAAAAAGLVARSRHSVGHGKGLGALVVVAVLALVCVPAAVGAMLTAKFAEYDDEGFYLYSVKLFLRHGGLYSHVVTPYGPAFHELMSLPFLFGVPLTHSGARLVSATAWLVGVAAGAVVVHRLTHSIISAAVAAFLGLAALSTLANEPLQPASIIYPSLALVAWLAAADLVPWRARCSELATGAAVALVGLCKLNIGLFLAEAVLSYWAFVGSRHRRGRITFAAGLIALTLLALGSGAGAQGSSTAITTSIGSLVLCIALLTPRTGTGKPGDMRPSWVIAGAVLTGAISTVAALLWGEGLGPMTAAVLRTSFAIGSKANLPVSHGVLLPLLSIGVLFAATSACTPRHVALLRLLAVVGSLSGALLVGHTYSVFCLLGLVSAPIMLVRAPAEPMARCQPGRLMLALVTVLASLQLVPVAGSQLGFSSYLAALCGAVCLADLAGTLPRPAAARHLAIAVAAAIILAGPVRLAAWSWLSYDKTPAATLAGSTAIHLSRAATEPMERAVAAVRASGCRGLITYPGMLSFYSWTGLPPPAGVTVVDANLWSMEPFSASVAKALQGQSSICLIEDSTASVFWTFHMGLKPDNANMIVFLHRHFTFTGSFGHYSLWVARTPI